MIVVTGIAEIAVDDVETIKAAARIMAKSSRAEAGCIAYAFYEDIEHSGRFRIYEEWESADALRAHFQEPHMEAFNAALGSVTVLKLEISQFERGDDIKINP
ncbi:MAG: putative quinol monooxygenase [Rhizobiaceae bacterium]|nr:putative quinol monooxygenase [Rhizobiaceae bacterium]